MSTWSPSASRCGRARLQRAVRPRAGAASVSGAARARVAHGRESFGRRRSHGTARSTFVVVEVALALSLAVGAALLGRSLAALVSVDMGFDSERLLVLRTAVPVALVQGSLARYRFLSRPPRRRPVAARA